GRPRDRIGEIEVVERAAERGLFEGAAARGKRTDVRPLGARDLIDALQLRMRLEQRLTQLRQRVVRKLAAQHIRQRAQDRPVFARVAWWEGGAATHLHAPLGAYLAARLPA